MVMLVDQQKMVGHAPSNHGLQSITVLTVPRISQVQPQPP
jgi:hypothetical protein